MAEISDIEKQDYQRFFVEDPTGFSPERNKDTVERSIQKYEAKRRLEHDSYVESLKERVDAAVTYIYSNKSSVQGVEKYFGSKYLAELQGQRILQKLKRLASGQRIITLEEVA